LKAVKKYILVYFLIIKKTVKHKTVDNYRISKPAQISMKFGRVNN